MKRIAILALILSMLVPNALAQGSSPSAGKVERKANTDPEASHLITSDIGLFWQAYDAARPDNNLIVFRDQYLKKGSAGLEEFRRARIGSSCGLVDVIDRHPNYFASLRASTAKVDSFKDAMRASFRRLRGLYDGAVFPDVYFLIGRMNSAGTLTDKALLIGLDMFGMSKDAPTEELSDWHKAVVKPIESVPHVVAHELIHYQQKYPAGDQSLLRRTVNEGSADFIAELISGGHVNPHLHAYGNPREKELWLEFKQGLKATDVSRWLYQGDQSKDRPADLGYYVGYKICEAYYKNAADKKQAVKDILEIKDFGQFLSASNYEEKFKTAGR
ncbi:MAG: DUF2268 domain-containing putative Zn-dependent protease [Pyrinomonadaceae bacterium]